LKLELFFNLVNVFDCDPGGHSAEALLIDVEGFDGPGIFEMDNEAILFSLEELVEGFDFPGVDAQAILLSVAGEEVADYVRGEMGKLLDFGYGSPESDGLA
jgi:hypothetical protein